MPLSFRSANIVKDLCSHPRRSLLRRLYANVEVGVGMSADAARKSARATMNSTPYGRSRKLSDIAHECVRHGLCVNRCQHLGGTGHQNTLTLITSRGAAGDRQ